MLTIAQVGGQTANALLVDRLGLGPAGRTSVTAGRVVAALAGAGMAVQQAVNGKVNVRSGDPWATAWINSSWGTLALLAWAAIQLGTGHAQLPGAAAVLLDLASPGAGMSLRLLVGVATTLVVSAGAGVAARRATRLTSQAPSTTPMEG